MPKNRAGTLGSAGNCCPGGIFTSCFGAQPKTLHFQDVQYGTNNLAFNGSTGYGSLTTPWSLVSYPGVGACGAIANVPVYIFASLTEKLSISYGSAGGCPAPLGTPGFSIVSFMTAFTFDTQVCSPFELTLHTSTPGVPAHGVLYKSFPYFGWVLYA